MPRPVDERAQLDPADHASVASVLGRKVPPVVPRGWRSVICGHLPRRMGPGGPGWIVTARRRSLRIPTADRSRDGVE
jgi:hypothetical protein